MSPINCRVLDISCGTLPSMKLGNQRECAGDNEWSRAQTVPDNQANYRT